MPDHQRYSSAPRTLRGGTPRTIGQTDLPAFWVGYYRRAQISRLRRLINCPSRLPDGLGVG